MIPEEYQQTARELARGATMPESVAARIEKDLEQTFEAALGAASNHPIRRIRYGGLAAAAALVVAVGAAAWHARWTHIASNNVTDASTPSSRDAGLKAGTADKADLKVDNIERPRPGSGRAQLRAGRNSRRKLPSVIQPAGFVPVPTASRLPQFESGVIVRMALPVAALPSYGVDISPASSAAPVEADVLVGQDGLARAIRLVSTSRSQQ